MTPGASGRAWHDDCAVAAVANRRAAEGDRPLVAATHAVRATGSGRGVDHAIAVRAQLAARADSAVAVALTRPGFAVSAGCTRLIFTTRIDAQVLFTDLAGIALRAGTALTNPKHTRRPWVALQPLAEVDAAAVATR